MKVEDMPTIIKRELAKLCMYESDDRYRPNQFIYHNFRIASLNKIDNKWNVTAGFQQVGTTIDWAFSMVIDDETGEVSNVTSKRGI
jgi:hypothetical protein